MFLAQMLAEGINVHQPNTGCQYLMVFTHKTSSTMDKNSPSQDSHDPSGFLEAIRSVG